MMYLIPGLLMFPAGPAVAGWLHHTIHNTISPATSSSVILRECIFALMRVVEGRPTLRSKDWCQIVRLEGICDDSNNGRWWYHHTCQRRTGPLFHTLFTAAQSE